MIAWNLANGYWQLPGIASTAVDKVAADLRLPYGRHLARRSGAKNVETTISLDRVYPFLRAGMSCDVDIITGKAKNALIVPLAAVVDDGAKHYAYVIKSGKASKVEVHKGLASDTDVVITSGLHSGDVVAATNVKQLKDGAKVKASPQESPSPSASSSSSP